jgi:hypothetical protein
LCADTVSDWQSLTECVHTCVQTGSWLPCVVLELCSIYPTVVFVCCVLEVQLAWVAPRLVVCPLGTICAKAMLCAEAWQWLCWSCPVVHPCTMFESGLMCYPYDSKNCLWSPWRPATLPGWQAFQAGGGLTLGMPGWPPCAPMILPYRNDLTMMRKIVTVYSPCNAELRVRLCFTPLLYSHLFRELRGCILQFGLFVR